MVEIYSGLKQAFDAQLAYDELKVFEVAQTLARACVCGWVCACVLVCVCVCVCLCDTKQMY
jgi:hypothetical protein